MLQRSFLLDSVGVAGTWGSADIAAVTDGELESGTGAD